MRIRAFNGDVDEIVTILLLAWLLLACELGELPLRDGLLRDELVVKVRPLVLRLGGDFPEREPVLSLVLAKELAG